MSTDLVDPSEKVTGPALAALMGRQRKFVLALLTYGADPAAARHAARDAGYDPMYGYQLLRDDRVLKAIREEATKTVAGAALEGVQIMLEIARDKNDTSRFQAAKHLMALNGFTTEQRVVVEHIDRDSREKIEYVRRMAEQLGMDARTLIEQAGIIIDADFEVVEQLQVDDSDW